jgi:hypothetical protein
LCCQGLVVAQHEGGFLYLLDDIGNGEGLSRACYPEQCLEAITLPDTLGQCRDGLRLVPRWGKFRCNFKFQILGFR